MTKAIEAAARALALTRGFDPDATELDGMPNRVRFEHDAAEAITAYLAAMKAEGFVMVPVEPTKAMIEAGITAAEEVEDWTRDSYESYRIDSASDMPHPVYRAMIAAATHDDGGE